MSDKPPDERYPLIKELLPDIEQRILRILSHDPELGRGEEVSPSTKPVLCTRKYVARVESNIETFGSIIQDEEEAAPVIRVAGANNPYLRFFKRGERAAIWRKLPPLSLEEMNLTQKAEAITEAIAQDFFEWLKNIGGDEEPTVDVPTIIKMFEIGFNYHAATSLCVRIREMPAVTDAIAEKRNLPEASLRVSLHHQLREDLKSYKQKRNQVAFGKMLPLELRTTPPKEDFVRKWFDCKRVPRDLATMAAVWQGIEGLRSTRAFCGWLVDHPEITPPQYLIEKGMLEADFLLGPHYSVESADDKGAYNEQGPALE